MVVLCWTQNPNQIGWLANIAIRFRSDFDCIHLYYSYSCYQLICIHFVLIFAVVYPLWVKGAQHDAHEFLSSLFSRFDDEIVKKEER